MALASLLPLEGAQAGGASGDASLVTPYTPSMSLGAPNKAHSPASAGGAVAAPLPPCPKNVAFGKNPPGNCVWYDPANPDPQHLQNMTYDKANESLNLLLMYTYNKLNAIGDLAYSDDTDKQDQARAAMGEFCKSNTESAVDCFKRFERYTLLNIQRMNTAIGMNESSNAALMSRQVDKDTRAVKGSDIPVVEILTPNGAPPANRQPTMSYMPTYDELRAMTIKRSKEAPSEAQLQASITNQFADWLSSDRPDGYAAPPDERDFPLFKRILRDPDHPSSGYFMVVVKDAKGNAVVDKKAYKAAMIAYHYGRGSNVNVLKNDAKELMVNKFGSLKPKNTSSAPPVHLVGTQPKGAILEDAGLTIDRRAFGEARHELVGKSNESAKSLANKAANVKGGRTPSASGSASGAGAPSNIAGAPTTGTNTSVTASGVHPKGTSPAPVPASALYGNEVIQQPKGNQQNQNNTYTVRMPILRVQHAVLQEMTTEIPDSANPPPAVELPPVPADE